jgi:hypothetical protein
MGEVKSHLLKEVELEATLAKPRSLLSIITSTSRSYLGLGEILWHKPGGLVERYKNFVFISHFQKATRN